MDILNKDIIKKIIDFLEVVLGKNYEIIYYETSDKMIVTQTSYNNVSNQHIGMPIPEELYALIKDKLYEKLDFKHFIKYKTHNNYNIISSCFFIKKDLDLKGVLCININQDRYQKFYDDFLSIFNMFDLIQKGNNEIDTGNVSINDSIIKMTMKEISKHLDDSTDSLTSTQRQKIVSNLCDIGVFNVKGSIKAVATHLKCSEASIYRYIGSADNKPKMPLF